MDTTTKTLEVTIKDQIVGWAVRDSEGEWTPIVRGWPGEPGMTDVAYDLEHAERIVANPANRSELVRVSTRYQAVESIFDYIKECGGVRTAEGWWIQGNDGEWTFEPTAF